MLCCTVNGIGLKQITAPQKSYQTLGYHPQTSGAVV